MGTFRPICIVCQKRLKRPNTQDEGFCFDIGQKTLWIHHWCYLALQIAAVYGSAEEPKEWEMYESNESHIN